MGDDNVAHSACGSPFKWLRHGRMQPFPFESSRRPPNLMQAKTHPEAPKVAEREWRAACSLAMEPSQALPIALPGGEMDREVKLREAERLIVALQKEREIMLSRMAQHEE